MLLAESFGKIWSGIAFINHDPLLLIWAQIYINKEKRRVRIIEIIIFLLILCAVLLFLIIFSCCDVSIWMLDELRQLVAPFEFLIALYNRLVWSDFEYSTYIFLVIISSGIFQVVFILNSFLVIVDDLEALILDILLIRVELFLGDLTFFALGDISSFHSLFLHKLLLVVSWWLSLHVLLFDNLWCSVIEFLRDYRLHFLLNVLLHLLLLQHCGTVCSLSVGAIRQEASRIMLCKHRWRYVWHIEIWIWIVAARNFNLIATFHGVTWAILLVRILYSAQRKIFVAIVLRVGFLLANDVRIVNLLHLCLVFILIDISLQRHLEVDWFVIRFSHLLLFFVAVVLKVFIAFTGCSNSFLFKSLRCLGRCHCACDLEEVWLLWHRGHTKSLMLQEGSRLWRSHTSADASTNIGLRQDRGGNTRCCTVSCRKLRLRAAPWDTALNGWSDRIRYRSRSKASSRCHRLFRNTTDNFIDLITMRWPISWRLWIHLASRFRDSSFSHFLNTLFLFASLIHSI